MSKKLDKIKLWLRQPRKEFAAWQDNRDWEKTVKAVLKRGKHGDSKWYESLIRSVEKQIRTQGRFHKMTKQRQKDLFEMNSRVSLAYKAVENLVSIQPISGPVGQVFRLEYEQTEGGVNRLLVTKATTEAWTRKFDSRLTLEAEQDLTSINGLDLRNELLTVLSDEISNEIITEVVEDLVSLGKRNSEFSDEPITNKDELVFKINTAASYLGQQNRRGCANFIVLPSGMLGHFKELVGSSFKPITEFALGPLIYYGTAWKTVKVFVSSTIAADEILIGYQSSLDAGYVLSPYNPVINAGPVIDARTFEPVLTFHTRYGKNAFYHTDTDKSTALLPSGDSSNYYRVLRVDLSTWNDEAEADLASAEQHLTEEYVSELISDFTFPESAPVVNPTENKDNNI